MHTIIIPYKRAQNQPLFSLKSTFQDKVFEVSVLGSNLPSIFVILEVKTEPKTRDLWGRTDTPKFLFSCLSFPHGFKLQLLPACHAVSAATMFLIQQILCRELVREGNKLNCHLMTLTACQKVTVTRSFLNFETLRRQQGGDL